MAQNKRPFHPSMMNFARRKPQALKALKLPTAKEMMIANAKFDQERRATAMIEYLKAQEMSQTEVVNAWDKFVEQHLRFALENGAAEEDLEVTFGPVDEETWCGDATISVRGKPLVRCHRTRERAGDTDAGVEMWDWCFRAELLEEDGNIAAEPSPCSGQ